jgi:hypothetical protein
MAKKKISGLPAGSALNGTELVPIVQTGTTKRITTQDIANLGNASGVEGSGTINTLAKFTASSTIGNSNLINDANGQLGLGATPSPWSASLVRAFQIGNLGGSISSFTALNTSNPWMFMDNNAYNDGTNDKYILSKAAARYIQVLNEHRWLIAPSGTAGGNITFTQAMTLDASGNLGLGTPTPSAMLTLNATTPYIRIERTGVPTWQIQNNTLVAAAGFSINNITNATTPFFINGTSDFIGIGTAAPQAPLEVKGSLGIRVDEAGTGSNVLTIRSDFAGAGPAVNVTSNSPLLFLTNNTERMRIKSSGVINISNIPTSAVGLSAGDIYSNLGILTIV